MQEILTKLGFNSVTAKVISYLMGREHCTSREIEEGMHLRQPEVSLAIKELRKRGWIDEHIKHKEGKGRPRLFVKLLVKPMKRELLQMINDNIEELDKIREEVEKW